MVGLRCCEAVSALWYRKACGVDRTHLSTLSFWAKRMSRGETIVHRMTVAFPLQLGKGSKALRFEVGVRQSLPLR